MNFTGRPVALPLDPQINRCLAHGDKVGEWCDRREQCACHETIKHDRGINVPAAYRKCMTDNFASFIPLEGFTDWDADDEGYGQQEKQAETETAVPAIVFYPAGSLGEYVESEGGGA